MKYLLAMLLAALTAIGGDGWYTHEGAAAQQPHVDNGVTLTADQPAPPGFADPLTMRVNDTRAASVAVPLSPARTPPSGAKDYRNERYRFELFYPPNLSVNEFDEGKGAMTITFQNPVDAQGFQIFIMPYGERQVSTARFKQDVPSGVAKEVMNIQIDGAQGTAFKSKDSFLGDTREVWFIHNGYLFELTTPLSLDSWLSSIMTTWKFI
jgi:hypothetical protein